MNMWHTRFVVVVLVRESARDYIAKISISLTPDFLQNEAALEESLQG